MGRRKGCYQSTARNLAKARFIWGLLAAQNKNGGMSEEAVEGEQKEDEDVKVKREEEEVLCKMEEAEILETPSLNARMSPEVNVRSSSGRHAKRRVILQRREKVSAHSTFRLTSVKTGKVCHCLFCYEAVEGGGSFYGGVSESEGSFITMFILKKMLAVPRDKLVRHLRILGNLSNWITICRKCVPLVEEAVRLQKEIGRLESCLRKCQEAMIGRIRETWRGKQEKEPSARSLITQETRKLVNTSMKEFKATPSKVRRVIRRRHAEVPRAPVKRTCGGDEEMEFHFGGEEAKSPEGSPCPEGCGTKKVIIDATEMEALNAGSFKCELCPSMTAMSANKLANHLMFHYRRSLKCPRCSLYYSSEEDLTSHLSGQRVGNQHEHQCSVIDLISINYPSTTVACWRCHVCSEMFSSDTDRDLHEKSLHPENLGSLPEKKHRCRTGVSSSFRNLAEWRLHRVLEHPSIDTRSCYYCDLTFKSKTKDGTEFFDEASMIAHVQKAHSLQNITDSDLLSLPNECLLCGVTFTSITGSNRLNKHMKNCHGLSESQSYACPVCPVKRNWRKSIQQHLEAVHMNSEDTSFICDLCVFSASNLKGLDRHKLSEHGIVPESRKVSICPKEGCSFQCLEPDEGARRGKERQVSILWKRVSQLGALSGT